MQFFIVVAVSFSKSTYSISENDGQIQSLLVLTNPSLNDVTVQVQSANGSATGE